MTSNLVERMAWRSVLAVIRVSSAMGQASSWPAARFRHSGVYDEGRKEYAVDTHGIRRRKESSRQAIYGRGIAAHGS